MADVFIPLCPFHYPRDWTCRTRSKDRTFLDLQFRCYSIVTGRLRYLFSYVREGVKFFVCFDEWILFNMLNGHKGGDS